MSRVEQFKLDLGLPPPPRPGHPIPDFGGATYDVVQDGPRLAAQYERVWNLMVDGRWRTLAAIANATGDPQASISARLRDFRKSRNGGHRVDSQRVADANGLFMYRLTLREP